MNTKPSKQYGSLFTALVMVFTMLGMPPSPAQAGAPASASFTSNALFTPITTITRVSIDSSGTQGNDYSSHPSISADGRYVAFESDASNLVSGDTNYSSDIFLRDMQTGITSCISVDPSGKPGGGGSYSRYSSSISADGRYVAFESWANNLVSGDTNNSTDIFLCDTQTGTTTRLSVDSSGTQANNNSYFPSISADGHYVAFYSYASNLVSVDGNNVSDIFMHDTQAGTTARLSLDSSGVQGNGDSSSPSISADGRYVVFESWANNLVSGDTNNSTDIFLRDMQMGTTTRLSVVSSGTQGNNYSSSPSISADGRYVAFQSSASNLVSGDTEGTWDIFLRDTQTGTTTRLSVDSSSG